MINAAIEAIRDDFYADPIGARLRQIERAVTDRHLTGGAFDIVAGYIQAHLGGHGTIEAPLLAEWLRQTHGAAVDDRRRLWATQQALSLWPTGPDGVLKRDDAEALVKLEVKHPLTLSPVLRWRLGLTLILRKARNRAVLVTAHRWAAAPGVAAEARYGWDQVDLACALDAHSEAYTGDAPQDYWRAV